MPVRRQAPDKSIGVLGPKHRILGILKNHLCLFDIVGFVHLSPPPPSYRPDEAPAIVVATYRLSQTIQMVEIRAPRPGSTAKQKTDPPLPGTYAQLHNSNEHRKTLRCIA